eukprot:PITA_07043
MKIALKPNVKPIKQKPYSLNPKYKEKVRKDLDKMLEAGIIEPVEESNWVNPMVVQEKKQKGEIRICVDLQNLNDACVDDAFPMLFIDEVLDNVGGYKIVLNLKKCIFCAPFGILLGHVVCKQELTMEPSNNVMIVNSKAPGNVKQLHTTMGHTRYYRKFIKAYAQITTLMEKMLKKDVTFCLDEECWCNLDVLKESMVTTPILEFPVWIKEFHLHVEVSCIALGAMITHTDEGEMDHPIAFVSIQLLNSEKNYSSTKC